MATTQKGTYYPSDYSKIADVPADMKKMAESIDKQTDNLVQKEEGKGLSSNDFTNELKAKLNNLENYDDTEVKQDISNLDTNKASKAELQEIAIALQAELLATRKDYEAGTLEGQAEGESLYLQDSSDARFREFGIGGNSKQEKREGYNLINIKNNSYNKDGCIESQTDKEIILKPVLDYIYEQCIYFKDVLLETKKTYTLKAVLEVLSGTPFAGTGQLELYKGSVWVKVLATGLNGANNYNKNVTFSVDETSTYRIRFKIADANSVTEIFRVKLSELMIYEGTADKQYEQYGAMPSLEFPSEIEAVGQDVNLLNLSAFEDTTVNGVEIKRNSADEFDLKGTATGNITIDIPFNAVNLKGDYTLSTNKAGNITSTDIVSTQFLIYDTSGNRITFNSRITQNKLTEDKCTITETVAINKARIYIANGTVLDCKLSFKLQKGNKATGYSLYNQGSANVTACNKNILGFYDFEYVGNGITINCKNNKMHISGTSTKGFSYFFTSHCNIKEINKLILNKKIVLSGNIPANVELNVKVGENSYYMQLKENIKTTSKVVSKEINSLYLYIPNSTTINQDLNIQLELDNATDYTAHEEQTLTMPVQQEMLKEDYLDLDNEEEVHTWRKLVLDGTVNKITGKHNTIFTETNGFYPLVLEGKDNTHENGNSELAHCNYLKVTNEGVASLAVKENCVWWEGKYRTLYLSLPFLSITEANNFLKEKYDAGIPVTIYYKLAEPTKLTFTEAQKAVAKRIRETLHSYKGGTHVYSVDEISPMFNVKYTRDLNAVINNLSQNVIGGN